MGVDGQELWGVIKLYNPQILSGVPRGGWAEDQKKKWCRRELGDHVTLITCESREKYTYCRNIGDILIDDRRAAGAMWEKAGGIFIHHQSARRTIELLETALGRYSSIQNTVKLPSKIGSPIVDNAAVHAENRPLMNPHQIIYNLGNILDIPVGNTEFEMRELCLCDSQSSPYFTKAKAHLNYETNLKKAESALNDKENKFKLNHFNGSWHNDDSSFIPLRSNNQMPHCFITSNKLGIDSQRDSSINQINLDGDYRDESNLVVYNNFTESSIMHSTSSIYQEEFKVKYCDRRSSVISLNEISEKMDRGTQNMRGTETEAIDSYQETVSALVTLIVFYTVWDHKTNFFYKNKEFQSIFCGDINTKTITSIYFTLFSLNWGKYLYENCKENIFNQRYGAFEEFFFVGDSGNGVGDSFRGNSDFYKRALYWIELIYGKYEVSNSGKCLSKYNIENYVRNCICSSESESESDHDNNINDNGVIF